MALIIRRISRWHHRHAGWRYHHPHRYRATSLVNGFAAPVSGAGISAFQLENFVRSGMGHLHVVSPEVAGFLRYGYAAPPGLLVPVDISNAGGLFSINTDIPHRNSREFAGRFRWSSHMPGSDRTSVHSQPAPW